MKNDPQAARPLFAFEAAGLPSLFQVCEVNRAIRSPKLLLFDIDGTLLLSNGGGVRAMTRAACRVFCPGFSLATIDFNGRLDPEIVVEALATNRVEATEEQLDIFRRNYFELLRGEVAPARPRRGARSAGEIAADRTAWSWGSSRATT